MVPHLIKPMQYDALNDFDLITVAVQAPNVLAVPASARPAALRRDVRDRRTRAGVITIDDADGCAFHKCKLLADCTTNATGRTGHERNA